MLDQRSEHDQTSEKLDQLAAEFVEKYRRGEKPDWNQYAAENPDLADQIRDLFPALVVMERVRPDAHDFSEVFTPPPSAAESKLDRLGDFRILREVGRGGMGIVYEAEQISLGRHVALKVLPKQSLLDSRYLWRFQNEARAAARLHHTNIVPVFGVGEHEGYHYYIMQFIHGVALDEVISELRALRDHGRTSTVHGAAATVARPHLSATDIAQTLIFQSPDQAPIESAESESREPPKDGKRSANRAGEARGSNEYDSVVQKNEDPRSSSESSAGKSPRFDQRQRAYWKSVARLGAQVADALEYAHNHSVLHRDIKPANLLLDGQGTVWVTDFGLARGDESQGVTRSGDIVGTMRYMAPEQLEGKADARSDIYSLGVTLYELLTLTTPNDADDRARLLRQILDSKVRRPRAIDSRIPVDLETIVLKAISRSPSDRYHNAATLATDLRRFLDDRPIAARRITAGERAVRWCRRNPVVSSLAAAVLILGAGLLINAFVSQAIRKERDAAIVSRRRAEKAEEIGKTMLNRALAAEREANVLAHLAKADAAVRLKKDGQRTFALDEIRKAAKLDPSPTEMDALRTAALAALVMPEFNIQKTREVPPTSFQAVDAQVERYAVIDPFQAREISIYQLVDDQPMVRLPVPQRNIWFATAEFTPDGRYLVVTYCLREEMDWLHVWDIDEKSLVVDQEIRSPDYVVASPVAIHPGGRFLVIPKRERTLAVWDLEERRETRQIDVDFVPQDIKFDPNGSYLAIGSESLDAPLDVLDFETGESIVEGVLPTCGGEIAFSPSGRLIAFGSSLPAHAGSIHVWDLDRHRPVSILEGHNSLITHLQFVGQDELVISSSWDGRSKLWNPRTGECLLTVRGMVLQILAEKELIALQRGHSLDFGTLSCGEVEDFFCLPDAGNRTDVDALSHAHLFNDTGELVIAGYENGVRIWDAAEGTSLGSLPIGPTHNLLFRKSSGELITTGSVGILSWPIRRSNHPGRVEWRIGPPVRLHAPVAIDPFCAAWLPGEKQIAFNVQNSDQIKIIDANPDDAEEFPEFALTSEHKRVKSVAVSPNGKWLAAGGWKEAAIQVWNLEIKSQAFRLPHSDAQGDTVFVLQFSPDSRWLNCVASNVDAPGLYIYETETWKRNQVIRGTISGVTAFSKDGRIFSWQSYDSGHIVLADPDSRVELAKIPYPGDWAAAQVFSDDGRSLLYQRNRDALGVVRLSQLQSSLSDLGLPWNVSIPPSLNPPRNSHTLIVDCASIPDEYQTLVATQQGRKLSEQAWADAQAGDFEMAREKYSRAIVLLPDDDFALNNLAWLLVTCPDETLRDPKQALALAQRAVSLQPNDVTRVNTLGVAQYRSGLWNDAVETLQRAEGLDPGKYFAFNGFFIAMAQFKLGKHAEAKSWFDRSVEWMNQGPSTDAELIRFHQEARQLLNDPDQSSPQAPGENR